MKTEMKAPTMETSVGGHSVSSFAIRWVQVAKPASKKSLAAMNRRLFANPALLRKVAEANTQKLTGQPSF